MTRDELKLYIKALPDLPGVYRYYNDEDTLIYVGKAKNLKKRVSSYFLKNHDLDRKTRQLVSLIRKIEVTIVENEFDALLLENSLIKQHQPRYNIMWRDDKTYPYIVVTREAFPRVFPIRRRIKDLGTYYGPFSSIGAMKSVLELLRKLYHIRTCRLPLKEETIAAGKFKVCLEYHLGHCLGPCEALQTKQDYKEELLQASHILKGKLSIAKNYFKEQMDGYASSLEFEKAQRMKDRLDLLDNYQAKSVIVNIEITDTDVLTVLKDETHIWCNYLQVSYGSIVQSYNLKSRNRLNEPAEELAANLLVELRDRFSATANQIISNVEISVLEPGLTLTVPQIGDKKRLVEFSLKNLLFYKRETITRSLEKKETTPAARLLAKVQYDLKLKSLPRRMECFDNSNIQGTSPVSSMVCFIDGRPAKKEYRHYNVKTVEGPNDFASMAEIVHRRYKRVLDENLPLPDLIIIDGGKGQLSSAIESLKALGLYGQVPVMGIAKRLEELYFPEDELPLFLDKKGETIRLIQKIRDEAHRFAITFHREKRGKNALKSSFDSIPGIGPLTIEKVRKHFKGFQNITVDRSEELIALVGRSKAGLILTALKQIQEGNDDVIYQYP